MKIQSNPTRISAPQVRQREETPPDAPPLARGPQPAQTEPKDSTQLQSHDSDRLLALGGAAATLGTVAFACFQGRPGMALVGGALAGVTGMSIGLPLANCGRSHGDGANVGRYVLSSLATLSVGVAGGALLAGTGHGLMSAVGAGAAACVAGWAVAEFKG